MHPDTEDTATIYANTQRVAEWAWKIAAGILAVLVTWALTGCVTPGPVQGVCILLPMGQTESGLMAVRYRCEPE